MIWALLAILGVPIWLIIGILVSIGMSRRAFKKEPGVFEVRVRSKNGDKWPRSASYGRVVSDVFVVNHGAAFLRTEIHAIEAVSEIDIGDRPKKPADAVGRLVTLDDGSSHEVAVARGDVALLDAVIRST
jgi:hypothetical protein